MEGIENIEKRLSALESQVRELAGPKAAADSGLVRFGDLELNDWFEYGNKFYIKNSVQNAREWGKIGDWRIFSSDDIVSPIEVEIREKVPGEVSVEVMQDGLWQLSFCSGCPIYGHDPCDRENYNWTKTATPKTKTKEEA